MFFRRIDRRSACRHPLRVRRSPGGGAAYFSPNLPGYVRWPTAQGDFVLEALEGENGTRLEWRSVTDGRRLGSGTGPAPAGGFVWTCTPPNSAPRSHPSSRPGCCSPWSDCAAIASPWRSAIATASSSSSCPLKHIGRPRWSVTSGSRCQGASACTRCRGYAKAMSKASARLEAAVGIRKGHDGAPPPSLLQAA